MFSVQVYKVYHMCILTDSPQFPQSKIGTHVPWLQSSGLTSITRSCWLLNSSQTKVFSFQKCHLKINISIKASMLHFFFTKNNSFDIHPSCCIRGVCPFILETGILFLRVCHNLFIPSPLWAIGLFPVQCCYEHSCYKYMCIGFGVDIILNYLYS